MMTLGSSAMRLQCGREDLAPQRQSLFDSRTSEHHCLSLVSPPPTRRWLIMTLTRARSTSAQREREIWLGGWGSADCLSKSLASGLTRWLLY
eukprot:3483294-Rhodomonas_salina.2